MSSTTLLRSFAIQRRVIGALLLREIITRFGRHNIGMLWLVAEPMIFTLGVAGLWTFTRAVHGDSIPVVAFAITGYSSVLLWRNTVNHSLGAVGQNTNLLYHRNVRLIDVLVTRALLEIVGSTVSFLVLTFIFVGFDLIKIPVNPTKVLGGWLMLAWFGAALAITMGAAITFSELVHKVWTPMSYLLFPLSGAAFMVEWLPPAAQQRVLLLPMVHGVELLREGYFGGLVRAHHDMVYMASFNLVLTLAGLLLVRVASKRTESLR